MFEPNFDVAALREAAASQCRVHPDVVEEIHPCSPFQYDLVNTKSAEGHLAIGHCLFEVPSHVDVGRLAQTWSEVARREPVLRSRIVQLPSSGSYQVVLSNLFVWEEQTSRDINGSVAAEKKAASTRGDHSARFALLKGSGKKDQAFLCWTFSYALIDRETYRTILRTMQVAYDGDGASTPLTLPRNKENTIDSDPTAAANFWRSQAEGLEAAAYPPIESPSHIPNPKDEISHRFHLAAKGLQKYCGTTLVRAAWSILLSYYTNSEDILFGSVTGDCRKCHGKSRHASMPTTAAHFVRVILDRSKSVEAFMCQVEDQRKQMLDHQHIGLQNMRGLGGHVPAACDFQTVLCVYDEEEPGDKTNGLLKQLQGFDALAPHGNYAMYLECAFSEQEILLKARYDGKLMSSQQVSRLLKQLDTILNQLVHNKPQLLVKDLDILSDDDVRDILNWNKGDLEPSTDCIHDIVANRAIKDPSKPAVAAWDGEFTYQKLDRLSSRLAKHLVQQGVQPNQTIPLCFEKSAWVPVAILAVLKAGATFLLLDPSYPAARVVNLCRQVNAKLAVVSEKQRNTMQDAVSTYVVIGPGAIDKFAVDESISLPPSRPERVAYILFTSGSTGTPKGTQIEHRGFVSCASRFASSLGMGEKSRNLQFASYAFGACLLEMLAGMVAGACICIPSQEACLNDLAGFIRKSKANWALLTPSFVRVMQPEAVRSLKTLVLGGEAVAPDVVAAYAGQVRLLCGYGQTETSSICSCAEILPESNACSIGRAAGAKLWIADPSNSDRLTAIGGIGELIVESPGVARGYIGATKEAGAAFMETPTWAEGTERAESVRFYKTGDLARYASDGSIEYLGRKDLQVKIRGQRVELGEVEYHVLQSQPHGTKVIAEAVTSSEHSSFLVVFVSSGASNKGSKSSTTENGVEATVLQGNDVEELSSRLKQTLPKHLLPSYYVQLQKMPMTVTGKTDRKGLRALGKPLIDAVMNQTDSDIGEKRMPMTSTEKLLQDCWARTLGTKAERIGLDDDFFRIGGDSILTVRLVGMAREAGVGLSVANIFRNSKLVDMAAVATSISETETKDVEPFALLPAEVDKGSVCKQVSRRCKVDESSIEDMYPCTELQVGMVALTLKHRGDYIGRHVLRLAKDVDLAKFQRTWESVVQKTPILRTRIAQVGELGFYQAVLKEGINWTRASNLNDYLKKDSQQVPEIGESFTRYALVQNKEDGYTYFVWTIHHALYDGWSLFLLIDNVEREYCENSPRPQRPFRNYIKYLSQGLGDSWEEFWRNQFEDLDCSPFPSPSQHNQEIKARGRFRSHSKVTQASTPGITCATIIRAAWSLVVAKHTATQDTVFGGTVSGRSSAVTGIEEIVGPAIASLPVRIKVEPKETVAQFLERVQQQSTSTIPFEQTGLTRIASVSTNARIASAFQTFVIIQPDGYKMPTGTPLGDWWKNEEAIGVNTYPLLLECSLGQDGIEIVTTFDDNVIGEWETQHLVSSLTSTMQCLAEAATKTVVADIGSATDEDLSQIWKWNAQVSQPAVETTLPRSVTEMSRKRPDTTAVSSWDGDLKYQELDELSSQLATRLRHLGISPGAVVPLWFSKSKWVPVAMLAVLKAGATFFLQPSSLPASRLSSILSGILTQTPFALVSEPLTSDMEKIMPCYTVKKILSINKDELTPSPLPIISSSSQALILATSGSTGEPKKILWNHTTLLANAQALVRNTGYDEKTRVFQFASYAFDVSIIETFAALTQGGCVCIPSESERMTDLAGTVSKYISNTICITPSTAQILRPESMSSIKTLIFAGEKLTNEVVSRWRAVPQLFNWYGPAESSAAAFCPVDQDNWRSGVIGHAASPNRCWVVDPDNVQKLLPVGATGELLIEGDIVAEGYLGDKSNVKSSFIDAPTWASSRKMAKSGRFYCTGDLVRYNNQDGSLTFVGRKDGQVKIRGQRVELGDVEHHFKSHLNSERFGCDQVVVDVVTPEDVGNQMLIAFVVPSGAAKMTEDDLRKAVSDMTQGLDNRLAEALPSHMIPQAYVPLTQVPMTRSSKIDRRALRADSAALRLSDMLGVEDDSNTEKRPPTTAAEKQLRDLWAMTLRVEPESVSADDNFLRVGGDSIQAMRLVGAARAEGLMLAAADVFRYPRLSDLAKCMKVSEDAAEIIEPFALLKAEVDVDYARREAANLCGVDETRVQDVIPCTTLQEGLIAMSAKQDGAYVSSMELELRETTDIEAFKRAWESVIEAAPILRTRIVDLVDQGLAQVVLDENVRWFEYQDIDNQKYTEDGKPGRLGGPLSCVTLIKRACDKRTVFVWTLHHAIYDGWSIPLVIEAVEQAYKNQPGRKFAPFQPFIKHALESRGDEATIFWQDQFADLEAQQFPTLPSTKYEPKPTSCIHRKIEGLGEPLTGFTMSTTMRAALSMLIAQYTNSSSAVFGTVVTGRQAPVADVEHMVGPAIATVPLRVSVDWDESLSSLLQQVQDQATDMTSFEQTGLQYIQQVSVEAAQACNFQTLLIMQMDRTTVAEADSDSIFSSIGQVAEESAFTAYSLVLVCGRDEDGMHLQLLTDPNVIPASSVERISRQLEHILRQICPKQPTSANSSLQKLADYEWMDKQDLRDIWTWNREVPAANKTCVHEMLEKTALRNPDARAVHAWDGNLSYRQLNDLSASLASHLLSPDLGAAPDMIVPLCFEKSMWTSVARLGVMKAGATSLTLDMNQPAERIRALVQRVRPSIIVSSAACTSLAKTLVEGAKVVTVDESTLKQMRPKSQALVHTRRVKPSNALYMIFTSGSTGEPKGVMITHENFASALQHHKSPIGLDTSSRVLDLTSHAFDMTWYNTLHTFYAGACLCVPSDQEWKEDLNGVIHRLKPNFVNVTPMVASTFDDETLEALKKIEFAGETATTDLLARVRAVNQGKVRNAYGPAECTPISTAAGDMETPCDIGRGIGVCTWVVQIKNPNALAAVGSVGELCLEGPQVGRGYFEDADKTAAAFIEDPAWLVKGNGSEMPGRRGRVYRTGDLVRYRADGSLDILGRRDTQVKIRGQRVELGEVEGCLKRLLADKGDVQVVADLVKPKNSPSLQLLAFICPSKDSSSSSSQSQQTVTELVDGLGVRMASIVPSFMVPTAYVAVDSIPTTATGKLDRRRLREIGASSTAAELASMGGAPTKMRPAASSKEEQVQRLCASVLNIGLNTIGLDNNFLQLGGDSISAMRFVSAAKKKGLMLTIADVLTSSSLSDLAERMTSATNRQSLETKPFALLEVDKPLQFVEAEIRPRIQTNYGTILDAYPVTSLQIGCLERWQDKKPVPPTHYMFDLPNTVDVARLKESCKSLVRHFDILRTVFVFANGRYLQVLLESLDVSIEVVDVTGDLESATTRVCHVDHQRPLFLGQPFLFFTVLRPASGGGLLVMSMSHALYDGTSVEQVLPALGMLYNGLQPKSPPSYVKYINHMQMANKNSYGYWKELLRGSSMTSVPRRSIFASETTPRYGIIAGRRIPLPDTAIHAGYSAATFFNATCAIMLAQMTGTTDLVFGNVVSGRQASPPECQDVAGPCANMIPMRLTLEKGCHIKDIMSEIKRQHLRSLPHESLSVAEISKHCTDWPDSVTDYGCLVHYKNLDVMPVVDFAGSKRAAGAYLGPFLASHPLTVMGWPLDNELWLSFQADPWYYDEGMLEGLLDVLCNTITAMENGDPNVRLQT